MKVEYYMKIRKEYLTSTYRWNKIIPMKNLDRSKMLCYYDLIYIKTIGEGINYYNLYWKNHIHKTFATSSSEGVTFEQGVNNNTIIKIESGVDLSMLLSTDLNVRKMGYRILKQNFKEQIKNK